MEKFYDEVRNLIKDKDYDFVISENITPPIDITFLQGHSLLNRLKRDKNLLESFLYNFRSVKKNRMKYHKKWFEQGYRHIFAVSDVLKRDIVENYGIPDDKISVIYPGVDISAELPSFKTNKVVTFGLSAPGLKSKADLFFLRLLACLKRKVMTSGQELFILNTRVILALRFSSGF